MDYADFEVSIHQYRDEYYLLFRFSPSEFDDDISVISDRPVEVSFDLELLREEFSNPIAYGQHLTNMLFADQSLNITYQKAKIKANNNKKKLRFRLHIDTSATLLHNLRWELLLDPETNTALSIDENVIFSRFLTSPYWGTVELRRKGNLHALVAISSPTNSIPKIDVVEELHHVKDGLEGIAIQILPSNSRFTTLENLLDILRSEPKIDILYLVCHGMMRKGQPYLLLENDQGFENWVEGKDFASRMQLIQNRPRLVVFISCQSAGCGSGDALASMGPLIVDIGVPAVIAMQYDFSFETAARFLPTFFRELQRDGQIDRAMAAARGGVQDRFDAWVPVLFMRLKSGRLWYTPGFFGGTKSSERLLAQIYNIQDGHYTPILGPGLVEPILGSPRDIAEHWADAFNYPMDPHDRKSLPQIAQFLTIHQDTRFPFNHLEETLIKHIQGAFGYETAEELISKSSHYKLSHLIEMVGSNLRKKHVSEPHKVLARLPLPIYITANQDYLLEEALRESGKDPQSFLCPWNQYLERYLARTKTIFDRDPNYEPSPECPIVFHLLGVWDKPDSVVLTVDHYFEFLTGVTRNMNLIPEVVRQALTDASLLILGFRTDEWGFRAIFHILQMMPGASRRNLYAHIAAQSEPEDERVLEPLRARHYLEKFFQRKQIDIYWGSPEEFMAELMIQWEKYGQEL